MNKGNEYGIRNIGMIEFLWFNRRKSVFLNISPVLLFREREVTCGGKESQR